MAVLVGGNLNNGANAGRWIANLNNGLGNARWNIAARISVIERRVSFRERNLERAWAECPKLINQHQVVGKLAAWPCDGSGHMWGLVIKLKALEYRKKVQHENVLQRCGYIGSCIYS